MNDVEPMLARDSHDRVRERQQVLGLAEERVARRLNLVKRQPGMKGAEPERLIGADHVHVVATIRQRHPQFGRQDPAASHRGIADDANVHEKSVDSTTGSRTIKPSAKATPASAPNCASRLSISWWNRGDVSLVPTASVAAGRNCET